MKVNILDIKNNNSIKSYKQLIAIYILFSIFSLSVIFISRTDFNEGIYQIFINILFTVFYIAYLNEFYTNYKFIVNNNYKVYTKSGRNLVIGLIIISVIALLIIEIFCNKSVGNTLFGYR